MIYNPERMKFYSPDNGGEIAPLQTSVGIDFGLAYQKLAEFSNEVTQMSSKFNELSKSVGKTNLSVSKVIADEINKIKSLNVKTNIAEQLKKKLEASIANAAADSIKITNASGRGLSIKATLSDAQIKSINQQIGNAFFQNFSFTPQKFNFKVGAKNINLLNQRFAEFINKSFSDKRLGFEFERVEVDENKDLRKVPVRFTITGNQWQKLINSAQKIFEQFLNDPNNFILDTASVKKIGQVGSGISFEKTTSTIKVMKEELTKFSRNLRREVSSSVALLKSMEGKSLNIDVPVKTLEKELNSTITKYIRSALKSMKVGEGKTIDTTYIQTELAKIKPALDKYLAQYTDKLLATISNTPISTLDTADIMAAINKVYDRIEIGIKENLRELNATIYAMQGIDKNEFGTIFKQSIDKIKTQMIEAVKMVTRSANVEATIDTKVTDEVLRRWSEDMSKMLSMKTRMAVNSVLIRYADLKIAVPKDKAILDLNDQLKARMSEFTQKFFRTYINEFQRTLSGDISAGGTFKMKTQDLHMDVKRRIAAQLGMSVKELIKQMPVLKGEGDMKMVMRENAKTIISQFHKSVQLQLKTVMDEYRKEMARVTVQQDLSAVALLQDNMVKFQNVMVRKVKRMIEDQFRVLINEVRGMQIIPASIGAVPSQTTTTRVIQTANRINKSISSPAASSGYVGGAPAVRDYNIGIEDYQQGYPKKTFAGYLGSTFKYMTSGLLMGAPLMAIRRSWESAVAFDYELEKARQNLYAKYRGGDTEAFYDLASENVEARYRRTKELMLKAELTDEDKEFLSKHAVSDVQFNNLAVRNQLIQSTMSFLNGLVNGGIVPYIQRLGINYGISQKDIGTIWATATRSMDNPIGAYEMAKAATRMYAMERGELSTSEAIQGMEAVKSQWGLNSSDFAYYSNMIMKAAMLNQSTVTDILQTQQRAGAVFRNLMSTDNIARQLNPNYDVLTPEDRKDIENKAKQVAFARSVALSSIFVQATARSGAEGGTFFRTILRAPFTPENTKFLQSLAQGSFKGVGKVDLSGLDPYKTIFDEDSRKQTFIERDAFEMFSEVISAYAKLRDSGNQQLALKLIDTLYQNRNAGSQQAIAAVIADLDRQYEKMKASGTTGGLDEYVKKILGKSAEALADEIDQYIGGMLRTFEARKSRAASAFDAATYSIYESLKPEIGRMLDAFTGLMNMLTKNANAVTEVVGTIIKLLLALGIRNVAVKAFDKAKVTYQGMKHMETVSPLIAERAMLNRRRAEILESQEPLQQRLADIDAKREANNQRLARYMNAQTSIDNKLTELNTERENIINQRNVVRDNLKSDIDKLRFLREIGGAPDEIANIEQRIRDQRAVLAASIGQRAEVERRISQVERARTRNSRLIDTANRLNNTYDISRNSVVGRLDRSNRELALIDQQQARNARSINLANRAFRDLGVSSATIRSNLRKLEADFRQLGSTSTGTNATVTDLIRAQERLNNAYERQIITSREYADGLSNISAQINSINATGGGRESGGGNPPVPVPGQHSVRNQMIQGFKGFMMGAIQTAGIAIAMDLLGNIFTTYAMSEGDRLNNQLEDYRKKAGSIIGDSQLIKGDGSFGDRLKNTLTGKFGLGTLHRGLDTIYNAIKYYATGGKSGVSISDYALMTQAETIQEALELVDFAEKELAASRKKAEENRAYEQMLEQNWIDIDRDGRGEVHKAIAQGSYESLQETLDRINANMQYRQSGVDTNYELRRSALLNKGFREDSDEMLELLDKYINESSEIIEYGIESIERAQNELVKGSYGGNIGAAMTSPVYQELEKQRNEYLKQQVELERMRRDRYDKEYKAIFAAADLRSILNSSQSQIIMDNVLTRGYSQDSLQYIQAQIDATKQSMEDAKQKMEEIKEQNKEFSLRGISISSEQNLENIKAYEEAKQTVSGGEAQIAQLLSTGTQKAYTNVTQRDLDLLNSQYRVTLAKLERQGYLVDSVSYKMQQRQQLIQENKILAEELAKQTSLYNSMGDKSSDSAKAILQRIQELNAITAENITKMYKLFANDATFGVPEGIRVLTNYEYYSAKNTQGAYAVQRGNFTVTFRVDKVYTTSKEELQKTFVEPVTRLLREASAEAEALNDSIKRGIQNR